MRRMLAALALTTCAVALMGATATAAAAAPLEGSFAISGTQSLDLLGCHGPRNDTVGSGHATTIGQAHWSGTACLGVGPHGFVVRDGRLTLTTSNGDRILFTFQASGPLPDLQGNFLLSGTFTVVGGTGRYTGATGGGTFTDAANALSPDADIELVGTINLAHG